jgi:hypothetical protein
LDCIQRWKGGEKEMKKMILTPLTVCLFALLSIAWMPTVAAKTLTTYQNIVYNIWDEEGPQHPDVYEYWKGEITGGVTGTIYFWETDRNFIVGQMEAFFEEFYIDLGDGWISGYDNGVWNFATFKFRAQGFVTAASENYAYMIGNFFFETGYTSDPTTTWPITGEGRGFIGP